MDALTAILAILVAIAILFEIARRVGVPYPTLFVLGGLGLAFVPGLPRIQLEPELVLLVFLPPLLFTAAVETPIRDLRANLAPDRPARRSGWCSSRWSSWRPWRRLRSGAGVGRGLHARRDRRPDRRARRDDRLPPARHAAARRRSSRARPSSTTRPRSSPIERRSLAVASGGLRAVRRRWPASWSPRSAASRSASLVGWLGGEILRRLDEPPVEVLLSLVIPFAAYLPADELGLSGVLAAVTCGSGHRQPPGQDPDRDAAGCSGSAPGRWSGSS